MDELYPCVAMYTEEVGISPGGAGSRALPRPGRPARQPRVVLRPLRPGQAGLQGRGRLRDAVRRQIQGVYVPPNYRGRGIATAGMAAVVDIVRREIAPVVSLYVNDWNRSARAVYEKVGFRETARFATVMF